MIIHNARVLRADLPITLAAISSEGSSDGDALTSTGDGTAPDWETPAAAGVPTTRSVTAGAGLTGGGTLAADRSFAVGAGTGITVNADDVAVDTSVIATRAYVDAVAAGLSPKGSVRVRAQGNVTIATPGAAIDGVTMAAGQRFLADQQSIPAQDGIYVWTGAATPATRATDLAAAANARSVFLFIEEGTDADKGFVCTNDRGADVVGTDGLTFTQFTSAVGVTLSDVVPLALNSFADAGVAAAASRQDHRHPMPNAVDVGAAGLGGNVFVAAQVIGLDDGAYGTLRRMLKLRHTTYDGSNGQPSIGAGMEFASENGAGTEKLIAALDAIFSTTTAGSEVGEGIASAALGDVMTEVFRWTAARLTLSKPLRLPGYAVADLPAGGNGDTVFCTDASYGGVTGAPVCFSAGQWRTGNGAIVSA